MLPGTALGGSRIKNIASFEGIRDNMLVGYGLVIGLNGTGDRLNNSTFPQQSLVAMLERLGVNTRDTALNTKNVAAVMVTSTLPPFSRQGHATNDKGQTECAVWLTNTAIVDLADYRNKLGNRLSTLDDTGSRHGNFIVDLDSQISDIEDVDITEAITRLTEDQTILEASFLTVSRFSNLNLSDFLR